MPIFIGISLSASMAGIFAIVMLWELRRVRNQIIAKWMVTGVEIGGRNAREQR